MDYTSFANEVIAECAGVPNPIALSRIRESFRMFCRGSTAYRHAVNVATELSYASGVYTIAIPTGFQIDTVVSPMDFTSTYTVYYFSDGTDSTNPTPPVGQTVTSSSVYTITNAKLQGAAPEWMDINRSGWRTDKSDTDLAYFVMQSPSTFVLSPDNGVDRSSGFVIKITLFPDHTTALPSLDSDFCNRWFDFITAGAKSLLMDMPNVGWSNPQLATYYKSKFESGVDDALAYIKAGYRVSKSDGNNHVTAYYK